MALGIREDTKAPAGLHRSAPRIGRRPRCLLKPEKECVAPSPWRLPTPEGRDISQSIWALLRTVGSVTCLPTVFRLGYNRKHGRRRQRVANETDALLFPVLSRCVARVRLYSAVRAGHHQFAGPRPSCCGFAGLPFAIP